MMPDRFIPVLCLRCSWPNHCRTTTVTLVTGVVDVSPCRHQCQCHDDRVDRFVGVVAMTVIAMSHYRLHLRERRLRRSLRLS